jgi:hypothetical protein
MAVVVPVAAAVARGYSRPGPEPATSSIDVDNCREKAGNRVGQTWPRKMSGASTL